MSPDAPDATVNALFEWLNRKFHLNLPLLPLQGWPSSLVTLWNMAVQWVPGKDLDSKRIKVDGHWKPFGTGDFEVTDITVEITGSTDE